LEGDRKLSLLLPSEDDAGGSRSERNKLEIDGSIEGDGRKGGERGVLAVEDRLSNSKGRSGKGDLFELSAAGYIHFGWKGLLPREGQVMSSKGGGLAKFRFPLRVTEKVYEGELLRFGSASFDFGGPLVFAKSLLFLDFFLGDNPLFFL